MIIFAMRKRDIVEDPFATPEILNSRRNSTALPHKNPTQTLKEEELYTENSTLSIRKKEWL
jgi:hypothetical protein